MSKCMSNFTHNFFPLLVLICHHTILLLMNVLHFHILRELMSTAGNVASNQQHNSTHLKFIALQNHSWLTGDPVSFQSWQRLDFQGKKPYMERKCFMYQPVKWKPSKKITQNLHIHDFSEHGLPRMVLNWL